MARGVLLLLVADLIAGQTIGAPPDPRCGANCVYVAMKALADRPSTYADVEKALGQPGPRGYSIGQLAEYANSLGLETLGVNTTLERLKRRRRPFACIGLIDETHFVLISDVDDSQVHVVDPPNSYAVAHDTFNRSWDGECLLLSTLPLQSEEELASTIAWWIWALGAVGVVILGLICWRWLGGDHTVRARGILLLLGIALADSAGCEPRANTGPPRIRLSPAEVKLGDVLVAEGLAPIHPIELTVENTGWQNLELKKVESSCGCAIALVSDSIVAPNESGKIKIDAHMVVGVEREATVTLWSNDPNRPYVQSKLSWRAVAPLRFEPPSVEFGLVLPGETRRQRVRLVAADETVEEALRSAKIEAGRREVRAEPVTANDNVEGIQREFEIQLTAGHESGTYTANVRVEGVTTDVGDLFVRWRVEPELSISPDVVLMGSGAPGEKRNRKVVLTAREGSKLGLEDTRLAEPMELFAVVPRILNERSAILDLTVTLPAAPGLHRWELELDISEPRADTLKVPVSAYVLAGGEKGS